MENYRIDGEEHCTLKALSKDYPSLPNAGNDSFQTYLTLIRNDGTTKEGGLRTRGVYKSLCREGKPLISIITVVYNNRDQIEQTICSVLRQDYEYVEYIVVDGGSTDGTLDIIKKYDYAIDYWISESDGGIYNAMNKGISLCIGDIVGIINSGDYYISGSLKKVCEAYSNKLDADVISGSIVKLSDSTGNGFIVKSDVKKLPSVLRYMPVSHPSTFVTLNAYKKHGQFDESFAICSDNELIARLYKKGCHFLFVDDELSAMSMGGVSERFRTVLTMAVEHFRIRKKYRYPNLNNIVFTIWYIIKRGFKMTLKSTLPTRLMSLYYATKK